MAWDRKNLVRARFFDFSGLKTVIFKLFFFHRARSHCASRYYFDSDFKVIHLSSPALCSAPQALNRFYRFIRAATSCPSSITAMA